MKKICNEPECGRETHLDLDVCYRCNELQKLGITTVVPCRGCGKEKTLTGIKRGHNFYTCDECLAEAEAKYDEEQKEQKMREEEEHREYHEKERQKEEQIRIAYLESNVPTMYLGADAGEIEAPLLRPEFLIFGDFGTGKTYAAYSMAQRLYKEKEINSFRVTRAFKMMMDIKSSFSSKTYEKTFEEYLNLDLLIVDEWGKNSGTEFEESVLFEIINSRHESRKRTGIIVNAKKKEDLLTLIRPDVLDRFRRGIVEINGKSRR